MNKFENLCYIFQIEMQEPQAFGLFHSLCIAATFVIIFLLSFRREHYSEKQLKLVLGIYSISTLILEILKQLIYSFNYDEVNNIVTWDYEWYAFPFQLCSTPMYACLICLFLNKCKLRDYLLSYISYITIWGSFMVMIMPDSCLVESVVTNIHTMWLHYGSFVVSIYLLMNKEVAVDAKCLKNAIVTFSVFVMIANILNIVFFKTDIINGETFNMFYISPYFESSLAVFCDIQKTVPYLLFLFIYIFALSLGGCIVLGLSKLFCLLLNRVTKAKERVLKLLD